MRQPPSMSASLLLLALGLLLLTVGAVSASAEQHARPESYYLAVLNTCYRAGAGMYGDHAPDRAARSLPTAVRRQAEKDWRLALDGGSHRAAAFCAHAYYTAIGRGFVRRD